MRGKRCGYLGELTICGENAVRVYDDEDGNLWYSIADVKDLCRTQNKSVCRRSEQAHYYCGPMTRRQHTALCSAADLLAFTAFYTKFPHIHWRTAIGNAESERRALLEQDTF